MPSSKEHKHGAGWGCTPFRATTVQPSPAVAAAAPSFRRSSSASNASVHSSSCASGARPPSCLGALGTASNAAARTRRGHWAEQSPQQRHPWQPLLTSMQYCYARLQRSQASLDRATAHGGAHSTHLLPQHRVAGEQRLVRLHPRCARGRALLSATLGLPPGEACSTLPAAPGATGVHAALLGPPGARARSAQRARSARGWQPRSSSCWTHSGWADTGAR